MSDKDLNEGVVDSAIKLGRAALPAVRTIAGGVGGYLGVKAYQNRNQTPTTPTVPTPSKGPKVSSVDATWNRMVGQESSGGNQFNRRGGTLTSPAGAIGAAQIMPKYGPTFAKMAGVDWDEKRARTDRDYNLRLGRANYDSLVRQYRGDTERAAAAYNAGPGNVASAIRRGAATGTDWRRHLPAETRNYIARTVVRESTVPTKYTREDIINRAIDKYVPQHEEEAPLTLQEQFVEKTQHLSENHIFTLLRLFNDLDESNQSTMLNMVESSDGVRKLLDFAIDKYIATAQ